MKTRLKKILAVTLAVLLLHTGVSFLVTKLVFDRIFCRYDYTPDPLPQQYQGISALAQEIHFPAGEHTLTGRFFDSPGDSLVVIAQGLNSHMEAHYPTVRWLVEEGERDVFIFDMTGSCNSEGDSTVGFYRAVEDLDCALEYISQNHNYEDIYIIGHSRGAYAACCVLSKRQDIAGVVAINGPNSPMEVVVGSAAARVGPLAYLNYPTLWLYQVMQFGPDGVRLSAAEVIGQAHVPVLIVQAQQDKVVPSENMSIYSHREEISSEYVEYLLLDGDHSSVLYGEDTNQANPQLMDTVTAFFSEIEKTTGSDPGCFFIVHPANPSG